MSVNLYALIAGPENGPSWERLAKELWQEVQEIDQEDLRTYELDLMHMATERMEVAGRWAVKACERGEALLAINAREMEAAHLMYADAARLARRRRLEVENFLRGLHAI